MTDGQKIENKFPYQCREEMDSSSVELFLAYKKYENGPVWEGQNIRLQILIYGTFLKDRATQDLLDDLISAYSYFSQLHNNFLNETLFSNSSGFMFLFFCWINVLKLLSSGNLTISEK